MVFFYGIKIFRVVFIPSVFPQIHPNITHSITSSAKTTKNSKTQSDIVGHGHKKGVTHIPLCTFQHPHPSIMTQVLRELPLPKVKLTIAYFNDDATHAESIIGLGSKGKSRLLLYFVNV